MLVDNKNFDANNQMTYDSSVMQILLDNLPCKALILKKETREIVYSNIIGRKSSSGEKCFELCANRNEPCPFCLAPQVWKDNQSRQIEIEYEGKWYEARWMPLTDDLYVHYISDITERKRAEEELLLTNEALRIKTIQANQLAHEAQKANSAKNDFLATMSHELRTPLNSVIGFSEILTMELTGDNKKYAELIYSSGQRLLILISDILDLSKIEANKIILQEEPCMLSAAIEKIEFMMRPFAAEKKINFEIRIANELPNFISTDQRRLEQCVLNVVNNAIKFTEKGNVYLTVSTGQVDGKPFIFFDVEDTGIGVSPEFQQKIFDSFVQEDGTISRRYGGTGLGLTISNNIAKLFGGSITLKSEKGKGSTFRISLPLHVVVEQLNPSN
ncbi:MAG: ATP-binding protein [Phycisphaerales bacterium]